MAYKTFLTDPSQLQKIICITAFCLVFNNCIHSYPANTNSTESNSSNSSVKPSAGNLKFTFGPGGEIPEAFFQEVRKIPIEPNRNNSSENSYDLCQNGSGGLCVPKGDCPTELKPQQSNITVVDDKIICPVGYECCYGYPEYERSCRLRGGGCVSTSECGKAPKFRDDAECDPGKDEICCILTV